MKHPSYSEHLLAQVKVIVESDKRSEIRLNANGGNSILIVCNPVDEIIYIDAIEKSLSPDNYAIIDTNELLISFVENNRDAIIDSFELLKGSIHQIFKAPEGEVGPDLFSHILHAIKSAFDMNKIPVLINTGALYGSGIDNIHLMENDLVMKSAKPLIILYPASTDGDKLLFLNSRPASKYRCMIVK